MFKITRAVGFLMCLSVLSGCATVAQGPAYLESRAVQGKPGHAVLYVFREYAEPTMWGSTVHIDDKEVTTLNQGGFTWVYAKPGNRKIKAVWAGMSGQRDSFVSFDIAEGKTYYVDLTGISQMAGVTVGYMYFRMGSGLNGVNAEAAEARLVKCCKFQKPISDTY